ncbi:MAG: hypothetical protein MUQ10_07400 [Anaerolineae bacterium]|nr:hypothetical protein [Anaerolineae bacterium]
MYRDPWRTIWQVVVSREMLVALIAVITVGLALSAWLPQLSSTDSVAYAQKLSEARGRFGEATVTMQRLGLLNLGRSFVFRALLALLGACLLLRATENVHELIALRGRDPADQSEDGSSAAPELTEGYRTSLWSSRSLFSLAMHSGSLIILLGFLLTYLWGWRVDGVTLLPGAPASLGDGRAWAALESDGQTISHSPGVRSVITESGPGFTVSAVDDSGNTLEITETSTSAPQTSLTLAVDEDRYFAVPAARLVIRLAPQTNSDPELRQSALVQVYRSPPGMLIQERTVDGDVDVIVDDVVLHLVCTPYVHVDACAAPGIWAVGFGIVLLVAGTAGTVILSRTYNQATDQIESAEAAADREG